MKWIKPPHGAFAASLCALVALHAGAPVAFAQTDPDHMALYDDCTYARVAAETAVHDLMKILGGELKAAMSAGGAASAIHVCSDRAPAITDSLSKLHGVRLRRVSERYRNPADAPTDLERAILTRFGEADAPEDTIFAIGKDEERAYLYMRQIRLTQIACLRCHGNEKHVAPEVRDAIEKRYPEDLATGFEPGDLRGAFSVLVPLETYSKREGQEAR